MMGEVFWMIVAIISMIINVILLEQLGSVNKMFDELVECLLAISASKEQ
jgi:uncharacterized protein YoxC